jgi:hypothetical protein
MGVGSQMTAQDILVLNIVKYMGIKNTHRFWQQDIFLEKMVKCITEKYTLP